MRMRETFQKQRQELLTEIRNRIQGLDHSREEEEARVEGHCRADGINRL